MALSINTNIASLNAQRNLGKTQGALNKSLQRLSSGLRINSAKDDAAGLAISNRMTSQVRGLNQAARNANDAISLAQTAEGALQESASILQRMRELAVQSANDTNTASDRKSLQAEASQLISEMDRIATTTQFNGKTLLDGNFSEAVFHVGANAGQTISMSISNARTSALGSIVNHASDANQTQTYTINGTANATVAATNIDFEDYTGVNDAAIASGNLTINDSAVADTSLYVGTATGQNANSAYAKAAAINASNIAGVSATTKTELTLDGIAGVKFLDATVATGDALDYSLTINGEVVYSVTDLGPAADDISISVVADFINDNTSKTGVRASVDTSNNTLTLIADDGRDIQISESFALTDSTDATATAATSLFSTFTEQDATTTATDETGGFDTLTIRGQVTLLSDAGITLAGGGGATLLGMSSGTLAIDSSKNIATLDVSTQTDANDAILAIDAALSAIDTSRGQLGATQNRFESTIANLQNVSENIAAARSRIMDADFAVETAALTKSQILQQAGVAMLAQANQLPQAVLSLLQ